MRRHVYYYTHLPLAFPQAHALLSATPGTWLPPPGIAAEDGWRVLLSAEGALPAALASREAVVSVGPARPSGTNVLVRPLRWRAGSAQWLFPVMEGELELAGLDRTSSRLTFTGSYRPPLSVVGSAGDQVAGHRAAEACVRRFVLDIAAGLQAGSLQV